MMGQVCVKIYYCGADGSGKTTSVTGLHGLIEADPGEKTQLVSFGTRNDRTVFFTFMPRDDFDMRGLRLKVQIFALSHQVRSNTTYNLVLEDADGIIFVVDSGKSRIGRSAKCFLEIGQALRTLNRNWHSVPHVLQYNKRDLPDALPLASVERAMKAAGAHVPSFVSVADRYEGIVEPFDHLLGLVKERLIREAVLGPIIANGASLSGNGILVHPSA